MHRVECEPTGEEPVPYAFVQDVAASWEQYEQITAAFLQPVPEGLILHLAGPTDEGFRVIDVWDSEETWQRFRAERLGPAIAALGGPSRPEPTFRDLHPAHIVLCAIDASRRSTLEGGSVKAGRVPTGHEK
jgi:hypothetical protein